MGSDKVISSNILKTSRRSILTGATALGLTFSASGLLIPSAARAERKKGGHLRIGIGGGSTTDTLDTQDWSDVFMYLIGYAVRGNLVEMRADGTPIPELAESFEPTEGSKTWIFKLRKGVQFSNGKPLTPEDVIGSLNRIRNGHSTTGATAMLQTIEDMKAEGSDAVVFKLKEGNVGFPYLLADYALNIMPFVGSEPNFNVGAGPYLLKTFEPGVRAVLERNTNSYKQGYFDSIEMLSIADPTARQNALLSGEIDVINRVDLKTAGVVSQQPGLIVGDTPSRKYYSFSAAATLEPFSNPDVVLALKYAIDRKVLVDSVLYGFGTIGNDQPITPSYKFYDKNLAAKSYDPDKARFHLKKAGLTSLSVTLSAADAGFPGAVDAALLYSEQAAKTGIKIEVERTANDGYWDSIWMKRPFYASYWSGRASEDAILTAGWTKSASSNESQISLPRVEELLVAARVELDEAKRAEMYAEIQRLISENYSVLIPIFANYVHAATDKIVTSEKISGIAEMDGARCLERWSFA